MFRLVLVVMLATPAMAQVASRRVVVMRFVGPEGPSTRAQLIANLMEQPGLEVVPDEEIEAARAQLDASGRLTPEEYVGLARLLHASAILEGSVSRRPRYWGVSVRVRNGADGAQLGEEGWGGRTAAALSGIRRGYARLQPYLEASAVPGDAPPGERHWYAGPAPDEEHATEPEIEAQAPQPRAPSSTRYDAIRVALTGGTLFRAMNATASVYAAQRGMTPADPATGFIDELRHYQSGGIGHFEPGLSLEVYPGALDDRQTFPYLGLLFSFTHSAFVQSNGRDARTGESVAVPTDQLELFFGLRGRYRFGVERREPEVFLDFGYGLFEFLLGTDALQRVEHDTIVPPFSLGYVQFSGGVRYGIIPTYLNVGVDLGYRIGAALGADTRNVWGVDTSPGGGFLFGVEVRTEIPEIIEGAFVALRLSYFQFTTVYRGQVGCAMPNGCDAFMNPWSDPRLWEPWPVNPATPMQISNVVGGIRDGVNDNYFRLQLQMGWAWR